MLFRSQCSYKLDRKLARCLAAFFSGRSVTELGAGAGRYKAFVRAAGNVTAYVAYDGLPNAAELSGGLVETADLSVDQPSLRRSDWAMSLEVFEPRRMRRLPDDVSVMSIESSSIALPTTALCAAACRMQIFEIIKYTFENILENKKIILVHF